MKKLVVKNKKHMLFYVIVVVLLACVGLTLIMSTGGLDGSAFAYTRVDSTAEGETISLSYVSNYNKLVLSTTGSTDIDLFLDLLEDYYEDNNSTIDAYDTTYDVYISLSGYCYDSDDVTDTVRDQWTTGYIENNGSEIVRLYSLYDDISMSRVNQDDAVNELASSYYIKAALMEYIYSTRGIGASAVGSYTFFLALAYDYALRGCDVLSNNVVEITLEVEEINTMYIDLNAPSKTGYVFDGWYLDSSFTTPLTSDYEVTGDIDLYAKYSLALYSVTFIVDDEMYVTESFVYGTTLAVALDSVSIVQEGSVLDGWFLDGDTTALLSSYIFTSDTILYSSWELTTCTVTLWYDGEAYYQFDVLWGSTLMLPDSYSDLSLANESGDEVDITSLSANATSMNFTIVNADYDDGDDDTGSGDDDTGSDLSAWWDGLVEFLSPYSTYIYVAIVLVVVALVAAIIYRIAK